MSYRSLSCFPHLMYFEEYMYRKPLCLIVGGHIALLEVVHPTQHFIMTPPLVLAKCGFHHYQQNFLCNSTKKRQHYFDILKAFFLRHSSEYKTSDSDRKVNRNIYPDAVICDRMRLIDPKSGQLEPIHHCYLVEEL